MSDPGEMADRLQRRAERILDLTAEIDQLWEENARLKTLWEECEKDNKQLEAEVEKLRRDNDLLREALRNG